MTTIDILPGSAEIEMHRSRNKFSAPKGKPKKGAIRNWEEILRLFLEDYWKETPSTQHDLTPYQQWVLLEIHEEFKHWENRHTRITAIEEWVKKNREHLSKENYERLRVNRQSYQSRITTK